MVWFLRGILVGRMCMTAAMAVSKSCTQKLRERGISVRMHTAPDSCNRRHRMYVVVKVILWHMTHPVSVWGTGQR